MLWGVNFQMTTLILKICRKKGQKKFLFVCFVCFIICGNIFKQNNKLMDEIICWAGYRNKIFPLAEYFCPSKLKETQVLPVSLSWYASVSHYRNRRKQNYFLWFSTKRSAVKWITTILLDVICFLTLRCFNRRKEKYVYNNTFSI